MSKKFLFTLSLALLTLLLVEVLSAVGLRWIDGRWRNAAERVAHRQQVVGERAAEAAESAAESAEEEEAETDAAAALASRELFPVNVLHPFVGYVLSPEHRPGRRARRFDPRAAQYGFALSREHIMQPPGDDRVILAVLGGSVASIFATVGGKGLVRELQAYPRFRGKEIVVVSLAMGGYKQPQQLMALNYILSLGAHFDIVLNLDGFNEVALPPAELIPKGISPHYPRTWWTLTGSLGPAAGLPR